MPSVVGGARSLPRTCRDKCWVTPWTSSGSRPWRSRISQILWLNQECCHCKKRPTYSFILQRNINQFWTIPVLPGTKSKLKNLFSWVCFNLIFSPPGSACPLRSVTGSSLPPTGVTSGATGDDVTRFNSTWTGNGGKCLVFWHFLQTLYSYQESVHCGFWPVWLIKWVGWL